MNKILFLGVGGIAGTLARYFLAGAVYTKIGMDFPYGTLVVNLTGCFIVGFLDVLSERRFNMVPQMRLMLITGFCGAFTTFSAFIIESYGLIRAGNMLPAFINIVGSVFIGLIVFRLGILLGELF